MNFVDYESSHITPQMTLLKKFNEVLKFLRQSKEYNSQFYLHQIKFNNGSDVILYAISTSNLDLSQIITSETLPKILFNVSAFKEVFHFTFGYVETDMYVLVKNSSTQATYRIISDEVLEL